MRMIANKIHVGAFSSCNLINERRWNTTWKKKQPNNKILFRIKRLLHLKPKCNLNVVFCATNLSDINKVKEIFLLALLDWCSNCTRVYIQQIAKNELEFFFFFVSDNVRYTDRQYCSKYFFVCCYLLSTIYAVHFNNSSNFFSTQNQEILAYRLHFGSHNNAHFG